MVSVNLFGNSRNTNYGHVNIDRPRALYFQNIEMSPITYKIEKISLMYCFGIIPIKNVLMQIHKQIVV